MKTSNCDELLDALAELQRRYPNWRFGQLMANVADWANQNIWDIEDEQLLSAIEEHLQELAQREQKAGA